MEINQMSVKAEDKSAEVVAALEAANLTVAELQTEIENLKTSHSESLASVTALKDQLESEKAELLAAKESSDATIAEYTSKLEVLQASVIDLEGKLETANTTIAAYVKKEKTLMRKAALVESGVEDIDDVLAKFDSLDDETFAAMTDMLKKNKDKTKKYENKASDADASKSDDLVAALDNVETTDEIVTTVGGEDNSEVESTRAALVNFVKSRLGKK
jgi:chromosome segregation ATPase